MKKIKAALFAAIAALALLVGLTAPASADVEPMVSGSSVRFSGTDPYAGIPQTIDLYNTSTTGYEYQQSIGTTRNNVAKTCPKNGNFRLSWHKTGDAYNGEHTLAAGQCFWPGQATLYVITLWRA